MSLVTIFVPKLFELGQSSGQHLNRRCLSGKRLTDHHETVTHSHHIVQLNDLVNKVFGSIEVLLLELVVDTLQHVDKVGWRQHSAREQVTRDVLEKGKVVGQELSQVDVLDGTKDEL